MDIAIIIENTTFSLINYLLNTLKNFNIINVINYAYLYYIDMFF